MSSTDYIIQVKDLTKQFGAFTAVDHITFEVHRGEIFGFLGANGAGKTTAMRMLCGLSYPTSGSGTVAGFDVVKQGEKIKRHIGYMSQRFSLYDDLTVMENMELFGGIYGVKSRDLKDRATALLQKLDFSAVPNLTRLKLTDLNLDPKGGIIFDFEPLTMLRVLRLKRITNYSENKLSLNKIPLIERVNLTECKIKELDINQCTAVEMVSLRKSEVEKLLVDQGFSDYYLYGDSVGEVVKNETT